MIEVTEVKVQGFCKGVSKAIEKALSTAESDCPRPITVLGSLVHNAYVNQDLESKGLRILEAKGKTRLELLDEIDRGTVIFTAHGISDAVRKKAEEKGLTVVDASCPFVLSTQKLIRRKLNEGSTVFYIGKKGHPESEGALEGHENTWLIETENDIPENISGDIFVTNQTTMSVLELQHLFDEIQKRYPQAEFNDEICNATRVRQQAVLDLQGQGFDTLVVVGDPASNNTSKLAETGKKAGIGNIIQVETAGQLNPSQFAGCRKAAVTSGASTPAYLKNEVIEKIRRCSQE